MSIDDPTAPERDRRFKNRHRSPRPRAVLPKQVRAVADSFHQCLVMHDAYDSDGDIVEQEVVLWSDLLCAAIRWHHDQRMIQHNGAPPIVDGLDDMQQSFLLYRQYKPKTRGRRLAGAWHVIGHTVVEYDSELVQREYYFACVDKYPDAELARLQRLKFARRAFLKFDTWHFAMWLSAIIEREMRSRLGMLKAATHV